MIKVIASLDTVMVDELETYITNQRELYNKKYVPVAKSIQEQLKKGSFNKVKAIQSLMTYVNDGTVLYHKDFGNPKEDWRKNFSVEVRKAVAESVLDTLVTEYSVGNTIATDTSKPFMFLKFNNISSEVLNYSKDFLTYLNSLQKSGDITVSKKNNTVSMVAKNRAIFDNILSKSSLQTKSSDLDNSFDLAELNEETDGCPLEVTSKCDKAKMFSKAKELGIMDIIASEISEKTGSLISKFGSMDIEECEEALKLGELKEDELDFISKKLEAMKSIGNEEAFSTEKEVDLLEDEAKESILEADQIIDSIDTPEDFSDNPDITAVHF